MPCEQHQLAELSALSARHIAQLPPDMSALQNHPGYLLSAWCRRFLAKFVQPAAEHHYFLAYVL